MSQMSEVITFFKNYIYKNPEHRELNIDKKKRTSLLTKMAKLDLGQ